MVSLSEVVAISSEVSTAVYPGNNSTSIEYPVPFKSLEAAHIKVGVRPVGEAFTQLPTWDYSVIQKAGGGWAVTTTAAVPVADTVVIWREAPVVQPIELPTAGRLPSSSLETGLDRATMQVQEVRQRIAKTVRMDIDADDQPPLTPEPGGLVGYDGDGNFVSWASGRVRELLQQETGTIGTGIATFADAASRAITAPTFSGQIGIQRDNGSVWVGTGLSVGNWEHSAGANSTIASAAPDGTLDHLVGTKANGLPFRVNIKQLLAGVRKCFVSTEAEFAAALLMGGHIYVVGDITLTQRHTVSVPKTTIEGLGGASLQRAFVSGEARNILLIEADRVTIRGIRFSNNDPLTAASWAAVTKSAAIELSNSSTIDISQLTIEHCEFEKTCYCVFRQWIETSRICNGFKFIHNNCHSYYGTAIFAQWGMQAGTVSFCRFVAKEDGNQQTAAGIEGTPDPHTNYGNGIWWGNHGDGTNFVGNEFGRYGRHGIEYWNSQGPDANLNGVSDANTGGNKAGQIHQNRFYGSSGTPYDSGDIGNASYAITAFGSGGCTFITNNHINGGTIGVEIYNDEVNTSRTLAIGNFIDGVSGQSFSLNNTVGCSLIGNVIGPMTAAESRGVQMIRGAYKLKIAHNQFHDSGQFKIYGNHNRFAIADIVNNGAGLCKVEYVGGGELYVGKRVYVSTPGGTVPIGEKVAQITALETVGAQKFATLNVPFSGAFQKWTITAITLEAVTNYPIITFTGPDEFVVGQSVTIHGVVGMTSGANSINDVHGKIATKSPTQIKLEVSLAGYSAYVSGGTVTKGRMFDRCDQIEIVDNQFFITAPFGGGGAGSSYAMWLIGGQNVFVQRNKRYVTPALWAVGYDNFLASWHGRFYTSEDSGVAPTTPVGSENLGIGGGSNFTLSNITHL